MPAVSAECVDTNLRREELQAVLASSFFVRSPTLTRLLSYLCEKVFSGEASQIKEYSIAVDVFGRGESFDQNGDSIVRVEVNRLRKRLAEYYHSEGAEHRLHITIPVGQYVPQFQEVAETTAVTFPPSPAGPPRIGGASSPRRNWLLWAIIAALAVGSITAFVLRERSLQHRLAVTSASPQPITASAAVVPAGGEIRILAGSARSYVDHSGKVWRPDDFFSRGTAVRSSVQRLWRTQDSAIYRNSRQGNDFSYDIPLKPGIYELRLHFAETYYGPEEPGGGGEGSRIMKIIANGKVLLADFDVVADAEASRTADVKVFTDITPAEDGRLHLNFSSSAGGMAMLSGIEIVPGIHERLRPFRLVARDLPYYSNDSQWWSADVYFKGGQLGSGLEPASGTDDPELYETERWGHFSYAIPVTPGKYTLVLHLIEHRVQGRAQAADTGAEAGSVEPRIFDVLCNGQRIVNHLNLVEQAGENRPFVRKVMNVEPNPQGKLLLEFVPVSQYATVSAIEILPQ